MSLPEPRWVPRLVIEAVHLDQIREHGGLIGLRDENALESALARARQHWVYEPETDLPRLAAEYAFGIVRNHPFQDGNERVVFLAAVIFLRLNGLKLESPEEEAVTNTVALAAGDLDGDQFAAWIRSRCEPA